MRDTLVIAARFCGPPASGNGGYSAGMLAASLDEAGPVEVTLRSPPPLDRLLRVEFGASTKLMAAESLIAEARAVGLELEIPDMPELELVRRAALSYPGFHTHPYPTCFVCGPKRAAGDGLRIFPGPVAGTPFYAASFLAGDHLPHRDGRLEPEVVWAALDCPGYFASCDLQPALLGRMTAKITSLPKLDEECVVVAWPLARQDRKCHAATALYRADGTLLACASQTWILLQAK